jgi:type IV pilus assembly protein PilE
MNAMQKGFTLIELMIAVVVIGILASIAIPQYSDYVTRGKLQEGTSRLADLRVQMERFYQDNRTYAGGPCTTAASTANFTYTCTGLSTTAYTITATGLNGISAFAYTIDQTNTKATTATKTGWGTTTTACWQVRKGGSC